MFGCILALLPSTARRRLGDAASRTSTPFFSLPWRPTATPPRPWRQLSFPAKFVHGTRNTIPLWAEIRVESREESIRKDLTQRLKLTCVNMSSADFAALVTKMTQEQLRGERIPERPIPPS